MSRLQPALAAFLFLFALASPASAQSDTPVFTVEAKEATQAKPQSKLWHAHGQWWALLPNSGRQSLWGRTKMGWKEYPEAVHALPALGGHCDVWPEDNEVTAVHTDHRKGIDILRLDFDHVWDSKHLATLPLPEGKSGIMTATIARDSEGHWWVAADVGGSIYAWDSKDALTWSAPTLLAEDIVEKEDLCLVTPLPGRIGVIWSDQTKDRIVIREHIDGTSADQWSPDIIIEEGNRTADNHLKAALSPDGTLWVASKNSVDKSDRAILVLRVRSPEGKWNNYPYEPLAKRLHQSRPAVYATADPEIILLGHSVYNYADPTQYFADFGQADLTRPEILKDKQTVILPSREHEAQRLRNITGPKFPYPADVPWIILIADLRGQIYEADLNPKTAPAVHKTDQGAQEPQEREDQKTTIPVTEILPKIITEQSRKDTDDPAIWIHPQDPAKSLVIGTDKDKDGALYAYNLEGKIVKRVGDLKRPNNVDIAYRFPLGGKSVDIAVTTERLEHRLRVFTLPDMDCVDQGDLTVFDGDPKRAPMGIALYRRPRDGSYFAFVGGKSGPRQGYIGQYLLEGDEHGQVKMSLVREFGAYGGRGEIEAIAVDEELGYVYYSDEHFGIRKYHADPDVPGANEELAIFGTEGFRRDREGIAIYKTNESSGYLLVSDQQANQFHIFPREGTADNPHAHPLIKTVKAATKACDGCEVTNVSLPPLFPKGLFVAMSEGRTFHYYSWEDIAGADLESATFLPAP